MLIITTTYRNKNERDRKAGHERKQDKVKKIIINYKLRPLKQNTVLLLLLFIYF